jgi:hypothetical protein
MVLQLGFDEQLIRRYESRGSDPLIEIHWRESGMDYPSPDWLDFGLVLLDCWFGAADRLLHGASEEDLVFMDGPYALTVRREGGLLRVCGRGITERWTVSLAALVAEILRGAETAVAELARLGVAEKQRQSFQRAIPGLEAALERHRSEQAGRSGDP